MDEAWKRDRIGAAERGANPLVLARLRSGFAVIGDTQFLPGYCVLLAAPRVGSLNELASARRRDFLLDMALVGDAIAAVCAPILRINYSILGNSDAYLHAHVVPRYAWEPARLRAGPSSLYLLKPRLKRFRYSEAKHGDLRRRLTDKLLELNATADRPTE
jgi:diadenosine tetraphosphate (Ap4A) HIT family hydrolase